MNRFLYLTLLLFFTGRLFASEINVTTSTIVAKLATAADGDVLLLAPGTYTTGFGIQNNKLLTIKSDGTGTVNLNFNLSASASNTGGGLIFDGVTIDRGNNNFISAALGTVTTLAFRNCIIQNLNRHLVRTTDATPLTLTNFEISNCIIRNSGSGDWALIRFNHHLKNVKIKNNTFYKYVGEDIFLATASSQNTAFDTDFVFENNTVYKVINATKGTTYALCNAANKFSATSSYTFKNNIVTLNGVAGTNKSPYLLTGATNAKTLVAEKNLVVDFIGANTKAYNYTTIQNVTEGDLTLASLGVSSIGFADAESGDFSIVSSSPLATASTTGGVLGDPRWLKVVTVPVNLTATVSIPEAGSVSPATGLYNAGDSVTVKAFNNFGYKFKEWQDANNQAVLSTKESYSFKISANTSIKAVFEVVNTFNFAVNKAGSAWGEVKLSPEPVNGKYLEGTEVTMTIVPNRVTSFSYWENNSTVLTRTVTVNSDLSFTATFDEIPFIIGWDFKLSSPTVSRQSDYYSQLENRGTISVFNAGGTAASWLSNAGISSPSYPNLRLWTPAVDFNANNRRYLQASFATLGYKNIQVKSMISGSNQGYAVYKMQYSLDGTSYADVANAAASIKSENYPTVVYKSTWTDLNGTLPAEAEGKAVVYVRWVADTNSEKLDPNTANPASDVEGTAYTNIFVYADKEVVNDVAAPQLVASVPASGSATATINGSIVLTFDERVKAGAGNITLDGKALSGVFGAKTVTFPYEKLNYNTQYTLTVPAGALADQSNNAFAAYSLTFKTADRKEPIKKVFDAIVAKDGSGDYLSVIAAIAAAPAGRALPWVIYIKNGTYSGHHEIPANKPFIHLIGQSRDGVIITDNIGTNTNTSWEQGASMYVVGADCYFENIIFQNEFGYFGKQGPPALAFYTKGDRFSMKNTWLRSFQDTYFTGNVATNRCYIFNSRIEGAVDYIYGNGNVFFDRDTLTNARKGSVIAAPSHTSETLHGYVFRDCIINEDPALTEKGDHKFGRPWQGAPKIVFINTRALAGIHPEGWSDMGVLPTIFADYGTANGSGNLLDRSQRKSTYSANGVVLGTTKNFLTDQEAALYTYENVILRNGDTWDPRLMAEAPAQPVNVRLNNKVLTWDATAYTRLYIVLRNNEAIGFPITNQFTDNTAVAGVNYVYQIQAVSEFGALSEMSEVLKTLPVTGLTLKATRSNQSVQITLSSLTERGTSHFVLERTADGKVFQEIGSIKAFGNSNAKQQYYFTDEKPLAGANIYRIKAVDFVGHLMYSEMAIVEFDFLNITIYPNPASDYIKIEGTPARSSVTIFNSDGKKVLVTKALGDTQTIDVSSLSPGIYIVEMSDGRNNKVMKFIKK